MPSRLAFAREGADSLRIAIYLPRSDAIVVNLDDRFWDDPQMLMRHFAEQRLFPSDNPAYPVFHELGHRAHYRALNDPNLWLALRSTRLGSEERRIIQREVGINAARDPLEFSQMFTRCCSETGPFPVESTDSTSDSEDRRCESTHLHLLSSLPTNRRRGILLGVS